MDLGPHAFFIVAAYAVTALIVAGLIARAVLDHRAQLRALSDLESRGARRLSKPGEAFAVEASDEARPAVQPSVHGVR